MPKTTPEQNKAVVLEAFDTPFNKNPANTIRSTGRFFRKPRQPSPDLCSTLYLFLHRSRAALLRPWDCPWAGASSALACRTLQGNPAIWHWDLTHVEPCKFGSRHQRDLQGVCKGTSLAAEKSEGWKMDFNLTLSGRLV